MSMMAAGLPSNSSLDRSSIMAKGIYLDNSTTARPSDKCISQMMTFYTDYWGIPSAPHQLGQELFPAIQDSYRAIYKLLGAPNGDDFVFTSSGAEAVNQVFLSTYLDVTRSTGKNQFAVGATDEAPAIMSMGRLEQLGNVGRMIPIDARGMVTSQAIIDVLTPRTALISLSWANGLTGVIQPVGDIAAICQERGVLFHLDATHVLGKLFFELDDVGANLISFNGDNIHGPKGTGGLLIRQGTKCGPLIVGGLEQGGHRAGSINMPALVGLAIAASETMEARDLICTEAARLRNAFEQKIKDAIPSAVVFFQDGERLPTCSAIGFPGIANEALLYVLNRKGVYASIGGGSFQQIGLVLMAAGIEENLAHSALSFSLSRYTTEDDIDKAVEIITEAVKKLRGISSVFLGEG